MEKIHRNVILYPALIYFSHDVTQFKIKLREVDGNRFYSISTVQIIPKVSANHINDADIKLVDKAYAL